MKPPSHIDLDFRSGLGVKLARRRTGYAGAFAAVVPAVHFIKVTQGQLPQDLHLGFEAQVRIGFKKYIVSIWCEGRFNFMPLGKVY